MSDVSAFCDAVRGELADDAIEAALARRLGRGHPAAAAFSQLLRGESSAPDAPRLTQAAARALAVELVLGLAEAAPVLAVVEDLHLVPDDGVFAGLTRAAVGRRLLVLGSTRTPADEPADARAAPRETLTLDRLGESDVTTLLTRVLGSQSLAAALAGPVCTWSEGNPFFVREVLRDYLDRGVLRERADGSLVQVGEPRTDDVPPALEEFVGRRLAALPDDARELLDAASCCGFRFDARDVGTCLAEDAGAIRERLARADLGDRFVRESEGAFTFVHHVTFEVIRRAVPPPLARAYHDALATQLLRRSCEGPPPPAKQRRADAAALCAHLLAAGRTDGLRESVDAAMRHHEERVDHAAAAELAGRCAGLEQVLDVPQRIDLWMRRHRALDALGDRAQERAALEEALTLARSHGHAHRAARALVELAGHHCLVAQWDEAEECARAAEDQAAGDPVLRAYALLVRSMVRSGQHRAAEALPWIERARRVAEGVDHAALHRKLDFEHGATLVTLGRHDAGLRLLERAHAAASEAGDARHTALSLLAQVRLHDAGGRWQRADELAAPAELAARMAGDVRLLGHVRHTCADVAYAAGRFEEAHALYLLAAQSLQDAHDHGLAAYCRSSASVVSVAFGRLHQALREHAACDAPELPSWVVAKRHLDLATLWSALGRSERALASCDRAESALGEVDPAVRRAVLHMARAQALFAAGSFDEVIALARSEQDISPPLVRSVVLQIAGRAAFRSGEHATARTLCRASLEHETDATRPATLPAQAVLAALGEWDVGAVESRLAAAAESVDITARIEARFTLFGATNDPRHVVDADRDLRRLRAHCPPGEADGLVERSWLYRRVHSAARSWAQDPVVVSARDAKRR